MVSAPARRVAPCLRRVKGLTLKKDSTRGSLPPARARRPLGSLDVAPSSRVSRASRVDLARTSVDRGRRPRCVRESACDAPFLQSRAPVFDRAHAARAGANARAMTAEDVAFARLGARRRNGEDGDDAEAMRREDAQTRFLLRRASSGLSGVESLATYVEPPEMATKKRYKIAGA